MAPAASLPQGAPSASQLAEVDQDAARHIELGYEQELTRRLGCSTTSTMGFATISPIVGPYAVVLVGTMVAGPAWVWVLPVAPAGQCLLLLVYQVCATPLVLALICGTGLVYLLVVTPHENGEQGAPRAGALTRA